MPRYNVSGWIRQDRDQRDYGIGHPKASYMLACLPRVDQLPDKVDLRTSGHMPPIVDQGQYGTCTANAAQALADYCEHLANGQFLGLSRAFQYWNTEIEDNSDPTQDNGGTIRSALKALANEGAIPEDWWPYDAQHIMHKPSADTYDEGKNYLATSYVLIDQPALDQAEILTAIKQMLAGGWPLEFGTAVFNQIMNVGPDGRIAMPKPGETPAGGHALLLIGYDDGFVNLDGSSGAFLIRNSWGIGWGMAGYGWMPYGYLTGDIPEGGISDIWALLKESWVAPGPCPIPNPTPVPTPSSNTGLIAAIIVLAMLVISVLYLLKVI